MHDVIIIGAGPIGLACAALLAERSIDSQLLDARPLEQAQLDRRLLALSRGSWQLLAPILGTQPLPRAPIREVLVSSAGDFGAARIMAADFYGADLGATVFYGDLVAALSARAAALPQITVRRPATVGVVRQRTDRVEVELADGGVLEGGIAVVAEGAPVAPKAGAARDVADWALLADVRLAPGRAAAGDGVAFERFTRDGPLALLPSPKAAAGLSMVWCMDQAQAVRRVALDDQTLLAELSAQLGSRTGGVLAIGPRRAVMLPQRMLEQVHRHRVVALGNAAQTLHPVAGQGFNLGLRDCATLADELARRRRPATEALARYAQRRRVDRAVIGALTRSLPPLFASRFAPLALARGLGLAALDVAPPLRREFAHLLMFGVRR